MFNSSWDRTYINRSFIMSVQFELGSHLYRSVIFLSIYVQFELGPHLYRSVIVISVRVRILRSHLYWSVIHLVNSVCVRAALISIIHHQVSSVWVFRAAPISIGHLPISLCLVWVFGTTPISISHSPCLQFEFWDRTYIDWSFFLSVQFKFGVTPILIGHCHINSVWVGAAPISIGHSSCQFSFWDRTYINWSLPINLCSVWVGTATISISHLSSCQFNLGFETSPISIGHSSYQFSLSWGHTYIHRPSFCQFMFNSSWDRTYINRSFIMSVQFSRPYLYRSIIFISVCVQFELRSHLYRLVICLINLSFWGRTYIDRPFSMPIWVESLGPHLYRSVIHLVSWVESCSASSHAYLVESIRSWATLYPSFEFFSHVSITSCLNHLCIVHCIMLQCYSLHIHSSHHPHLWLESHLPSMCP